MVKKVKIPTKTFRQAAAVVLAFKSVVTELTEASKWQANTLNKQKISVLRVVYLAAFQKNLVCKLNIPISSMNFSLKIEVVKYYPVSKNV